MIRLIIKRSSMCPEGAVVKCDYLTLETELPELEKLLKSAHTYEERWLVGVEICPTQQHSEQP
jgi:hypothetical protein